MSKSNVFESELLAYVFQDVPISGLSGLTEFWVALHSADPGDAGDQSTNEIVYTPYSRVSVDRTVFGWALLGDTVSPFASIDFPIVTTGSGTATHFTVGRDETGPGYVFYHGTVTPSIDIVPASTPRLTTATEIRED